MMGRVLKEETFPQFNSLPLYGSMASMAGCETVFTPASSTDIWDGLDTSDHLINALRHHRPRIARYIQMLTAREDVTDHRLVRDHGLLSAMSLVYGLYLVKVTLAYEMSIKPSVGLADILVSLSHTLIDLKGVFHHDKGTGIIPIL